MLGTAQVGMARPALFIYRAVHARLSPGQHRYGTLVLGACGSSAFRRECERGKGAHAAWLLEEYARHA
jgi:hypothetical protein